MKSYIGNKGINDVSFKLIVIESSGAMYAKNIKHKFTPYAYYIFYIYYVSDDVKSKILRCLGYYLSLNKKEKLEMIYKVSVLLKWKIISLIEIFENFTEVLKYRLYKEANEIIHSKSRRSVIKCLKYNEEFSSIEWGEMKKELQVRIFGTGEIMGKLVLILFIMVLFGCSDKTSSEEKIVTDNDVTLNPATENYIITDTHENGVIISDDIFLGNEIPPIIEDVIILDSEGLTISETENLVINEDKKVELIFPHDSILTENSTLNVEVPFDEGNFTIESDVDVVDTIVDNELKLFWPINCEPGVSCSLGHADVDSNGVAFNCNEPGYIGHEGIDIALMSWSQMDAGVDVYAAQSGIVLWAFDHAGAHDKCTSESIEPECLPANTSYYPGMDNGYTVCTELGAYCPVDSGSTACYWCFNGKNIVVIKHDQGGVFATRYDHLKSGSLLVKKGDYVKRGDKIAEVGSAGNSTGPHLHFEVWGNDYYSLVEAFSGECGPNYTDSLWGVEIAPWKVHVGH